MKAKIAILTTALAGALAAASAAHADVKVYPGGACQAQFGTQAADLITANIFTINTGAADLVVTCPIVRDNHKNLNGITAFVRVQSDGGNPLTCSLESYTAFGVFVARDSNSTTSNAVTSLRLDINTSTVGGAYILSCILPQETMVYGYRVNEF